MKTWKNRPVITKQDHPQTVFDALTESLAYYREHRTVNEAMTWRHTVENSREDLDSDFMLFAPEYRDSVPESNESVLYMSPDQLELALVIHGVKHITDAAEVQKVDELLKSIDSIQAEDRR